MPKTRRRRRKRKTRSKKRKRSRKRRPKKRKRSRRGGVGPLPAPDARGAPRAGGRVALAAHQRDITRLFDKVGELIDVVNRCHPNECRDAQAELPVAEPVQQARREIASKPAAPGRARAAANDGGGGGGDDGPFDYRGPHSILRRDDALMAQYLEIFERRRGLGASVSEARQEARLATILPPLPPAAVIAAARAARAATGAGRWRLGDAGAVGHAALQRQAVSVREHFATWRAASPVAARVLIANFITEAGTAANAAAVAPFRARISPRWGRAWRTRPERLRQDWERELIIFRMMNDHVHFERHLLRDLLPPPYPEPQGVARQEGRSMQNMNNTILQRQAWNRLRGDWN